jgi:hypothetical protein
MKGLAKSAGKCFEFNEKLKYNHFIGEIFRPQYQSNSPNDGPTPIKKWAV